MLKIRSWNLEEVLQKYCMGYQNTKTSKRTVINFFKSPLPLSFHYNFTSMMHHLFERTGWLLLFWIRHQQFSSRVGVFQIDTYELFPFCCVHPSVYKNESNILAQFWKSITLLSSTLQQQHVSDYSRENNYSVRFLRLIKLKKKIKNYRIVWIFFKKSPPSQREHLQSTVTQAAYGIYIFI